VSARLGPGAERVEAWLEANPGGKAREDDDGWRGTVPVDGERWLLADPCAGPGDLADALDLRVGDAAAVRVIEAEHPGWLARRWSDGTWGAVYPLGPDAVSLHVIADGAAGLREPIRAKAVTAP